MGDAGAKKSTLIVGGTGKTGRRVAERLMNKGLPVRIGSRSGKPRFDWADERTWLPALESVESAYITFYPDLGFPGASDSVAAFAKVAVESGVRRLVLLSGRGDEGALRSEQAVRESGAEWTIVRASWFNQNFSESFFLESVLSGELAFPAGDVLEPFIDVEDIADVAAEALTEDKHRCQLYEITGPQLLTFAAAIAEIAKATGREIRYVPVAAEQYEAVLLEHGLPTHFVTPLMHLITTVLDGRNAHVTDGLQRVLGRKPRTLADYARNTAATGVWGVQK